MWNMTDEVVTTTYVVSGKPQREHTAVRLSPAGLTRVRELAQAETEGNVSQMIRKLLAEAITTRDKAKR